MSQDIREIEGWFTEPEGERLGMLAASVPADRAIVEVGTYQGRSACWMATYDPVAHIFCIDPWSESWEIALPAFLGNVDRGGWGDRITPLRGEATVISLLWVQPVGLLFLDAVHEYAPTRRDFEAWAPHVEHGGYVAFHDCDPTWPGVQQVVAEVLARGGWDDVNQTDSLRILRRQ